MSEVLKTGDFKFSAKSKTGYRLSMSGSVYGPPHGNVIVAALDHQLTDNVDVLLAAPELLEALVETTDFMERHSNRFDGTTRHPALVIENARAAITKAEGRA